MYQDEKSLPECPIKPLNHEQQMLAYAIALLESYGWQQGGYGVFKAGPHCLMGAIYAASGEGSMSSNYSNRLGGAVINEINNGRHGGYYYPSPEAWNDRPERTKNEVIAVMRRAVERLA